MTVFPHPAQGLNLGLFRLHLIRIDPPRKKAGSVTAKKKQIRANRKTTRSRRRMKVVEGRERERTLLCVERGAKTRGNLSQSTLHYRVATMRLVEAYSVTHRERCFRYLRKLTLTKIIPIMSFTARCNRIPRQKTLSTRSLIRREHKRP